MAYERVTVERVYEQMPKGFSVGPWPYETCDNCPHVWGGHIMESHDDKAEHGAWFCAEPGCDCGGSWALPGAPGWPDLN